MTVALRSQTHLGYGSHTNPSLTAPAGIVNGDVLLMLAATFNLSSGTVPLTPTPPAGWVGVPGSTAGLLTSLNNWNGAANCGAIFAWTKVASSEGSTYVITQAVGSSDYWIGAYTGVDTTTPVPSGWTTSSSSGPGSDSTLPSVTPTVNGSRVAIVSMDNGDNSGTITPPTGTTPTFTQEISSSVVLDVMDGTLATAAATGTKTFTTNSATGAPRIAGMLVVNASGGAPATLAISVSDAITTGNTPAVTLVASGTLAVNVSDAVTTTNAPTTGSASIPGIVKADAVTTSDAPSVQVAVPQLLPSTSLYPATTLYPGPLSSGGDLNVSVADAVTTTNTPSVTRVPSGVLAISVADAVTTTNTPTAQRTGTPPALSINTSDRVTTADRVGPGTPPPIQEPTSAVITGTHSAAVVAGATSSAALLTRSGRGANPIIQEPTQATLSIVQTTAVIAGAQSSANLQTRSGIEPFSALFSAPETFESFSVEAFEEPEPLVLPIENLDADLWVQVDTRGLWASDGGILPDDATLTVDGAPLSPLYQEPTPSAPVQSYRLPEGSLLVLSSPSSGIAYSVTTSRSTEGAPWPT